MIKTIATLAMAAALVPTTIFNAPKEEKPNKPWKGIVREEQKRPPKRTPGGRRPVDKLIEAALIEIDLI